VELLENVRGDLALQEVCGWDHDVVAGLAREQPRLQRLVGVEGVVDHLDAGLLGEILQDIRRHIVRPIVEIDDALPGPRLGRYQQCRSSERQEEAKPARGKHPYPTFLRRCTASDRRSSAVSRVASFFAKQNRTTVVTASCS